MSAAARPRRRPFAGLSSFVVGMFTRNLGAKIAALVLAWLVWFTVRQDITGEYLDRRARIHPILDDGLMLVQKPPEPVTVKWVGPSSRVRELQSRDFTEVQLRVRRNDLTGNRGTFLFSVDQGNLGHPYGNEVRIDEIEPGPITLKVAVRAVRTLPVRPPEVRGLPVEWTVKDLKLLTTQVTVTGPRDVLQTLTDAKPAPITVGRDVRIRGDREEEVFDGLTLDLDPDLKARYVGISGRKKIAYRLVLVRSGEERSLAVPFTVYYETGDLDSVLEPQPSDALKSTDGGWQIVLTFIGARSDLEAVAKEVAAGSIRAYVRASDAAANQPGERFYGQNLTVFLEGMADFAGRVRFRPPQPESLEFIKKKRE